MNCALTGHRELDASFDINRLYDLLEQTIKEGYSEFYCGMAAGFDLAALQCLCDLREKYPIRIVACVPYLGQEHGFPEKERKKYRRLIALCDKTEVLSEEYYAGCFFTRNRYMVDKADLLIAYMTHEKGGTAYTVRYARERGREVRFI